MVQLWQEPADDEEVGDAVDVVAEGRTPPGWCRVFDGVDADDRAVSLVHEDTPALRRMAVLDVLVNNADRKGGHVLPMPDGHRWGVDHGVTFHVEDKLRTVLWGWAGSRLTDEDRAVVARVRAALDEDLGAALLELLTAREVAAARRRCERLLADDRMPDPGGRWPAIPWPPF